MFVGLCIDLLDKLKEVMRFEYKLEISAGNRYGAQDLFTLEWNGLVRHLIDAVSCLTCVWVKVMFCQ